MEREPETILRAAPAMGGDAASGGDMAEAREDVPKGKGGAAGAGAGPEGEGGWSEGADVEAEDESTGDESGSDARRPAKKKLEIRNSSFPVGVGVVGWVENYYAAEILRPSFAPITEQELERELRFFTPPAGWSRQIAALAEIQGQIAVVHGAEHAGKLTCALKVAMEMLELDTALKVVLCRMRSEETLALAEVIRSEPLAAHAVIVIEDAFATGVELRELEAVAVGELARALHDKTSRLVLTTELGTDTLAPLPVVKIAVSAPPLDEVFASYLKSFDLDEKVRNRLASLGPRARGTLHLPVQVASFFAALAKSAPRTEREILALAQDAAEVGQEDLRAWFGGLRGSEQLFTLLRGVMGEMRRPTLERLFVQVVQALRAAGNDWLDDPLRLGFDDLLEGARARDNDGIVEFRERTYEIEVRRQARSRREMLWEVLEWLIGEIGPGGDWEDWELRRGLGTALGRLAAGDRERFLRQLKRVAENPWRTAAAIAGRALAAAVRDDTGLRGHEAAGLLREWIVSGEPDLMWAAAAAVWKVFAAAAAAADEALKQALLKHLETLVLRSATFTKEVRNRVRERAKSGLREGADAARLAAAEAEAKKKLWAMGKANRDCAAISLMQVVLIDSRCAPTLALWLKRDKLRQVAQDAIERLFDGLGEPRTKPSAARFGSLIEQLEPLLATSGSGPAVDAMITALRAWLRWEEWRRPVFKELLGVANRGSGAVRDGLRGALSRRWLAGGDAPGEKEAAEIALAVVARSYAMDGILMDRPSLGRGVFVLDPACVAEEPAPAEAGQAVSRQAAAQRQSREASCRHLLGALEAQLPVSFVHLGSHRAVALDGGTAAPLNAASAGPRLLLPAVAAAGGDDPSMVLVVSGGPIWDLSDAAGEEWAENLLVIAAGQDAETCEGVTTIRAGAEITPQDVARVEAQLQARWALALARATAEQWRPALRSCGIEEDLADDPRLVLDSWVEALPAPGQADGQRDLAHRVLCVLCWYAALDLEGCVGLLRSWLSGNGEGSGASCRRWMGAAGAKALLRIHSAYRPRVEDVAPRVLFEGLAHPLARCGDGAEAVLQAAGRWLESETWAAYLAGGVVNGRGRLLRWAEELAPSHAEALRAALASSPPVVPEEAAGGWREAVAALIDRLRIGVSLAQPKALPLLSAGERYGVILLDPSGADLAALGAELFTLLAKQEGRRVKPVLYRLGERSPAWVSSEVPPQPSLLGPLEEPLPRLVGPILASRELSPQAVAFVLVLSHETPLDVGDWLATPWRQRLHFYQPGAGGALWPAFAALPVLSGQEAPAIARHLEEAQAGGL